MRGHATSIFAGFATALICLPEYLGLGAMIGSATGGGANATGVAALLVVISVVLTCMPIRKQAAVISGPRAASVSAMIAMLGWIAPSAPSLSMIFLAAPAIVMLASLIGLIGSHAKFIKFIQRTPDVASHTFLFVTGVGIISQALRQQYAPCIEASPIAAPALLIFLALLTVGAIELKRTNKYRWASVLPLAVIAAAWGLHVLLIGSGSQGACRPLGASGIHWASWLDYLYNWNKGFAGSAWSMAYILKVLAAGFVLGGVMALENHMFLKSIQTSASAAANLNANSLLVRNAGQNIASGILTGMPASMSTARTRLVQQFNGTGRLAVWSHGLALILILGLGQSWIAQFPAMAVCAALLLAGLLMIDKAMAEDFWPRGMSDNGGLNHGLWIFAVCIVVGSLLQNGNWIAMLLALVLKFAVHRIFVASICKTTNV
jgi:MFS superfamily sulfate permease-like transporter